MSVRGRTILLTRDPAESSQFILDAERGGARIIAIPTIAIRDPDTWDACDRAIGHLDRWTALAFTSVHGVRRFLGRVIQKSGSLDSVRPLSVYAVGEKTAREISWHGLRADVVPGEFSGSGLAAALGTSVHGAMRVLLPQGDRARPDLADALRAMGAVVDSVVVYRTLPAGDEHADHLRSLLSGNTIDVIAFASPSAVQNLARLLSTGGGSAPSPPMPRIAAIGPTTAAAVAEQGWTCNVVAGLSTMESLLGAIESLFLKDE